MTAGNYNTSFQVLFISVHKLFLVREMRNIINV